LLQANAVVVRKHFVNGELVEVKAIEGGVLVLIDGRVIPENYRTFTHGYAVTSHAAQGKTVDQVMVVASARALSAVSQEQFYVSISRGRERCQVFTDDAELLRSHVTRSSARLAAVEAVPHHKFGQSIWQRSYQFLKQLRQRLVQRQSLSPRSGIHHQPKHQHEYKSSPRIRRQSHSL